MIEAIEEGHPILPIKTAYDEDHLNYNDFDNDRLMYLLPNGVNTTESERKDFGKLLHDKIIHLDSMNDYISNYMSYINRIRIVLCGVKAIHKGVAITHREIMIDGNPRIARHDDCIRATDTHILRVARIHVSQNPNNFDEIYAHITLFILKDSLMDNGGVPKQIYGRDIGALYEKEEQLKVSAGNEDLSDCSFKEEFPKESNRVMISIYEFIVTGKLPIKSRKVKIDGADMCALYFSY